jgi:cytoskeletal protein RodZ
MEETHGFGCSWPQARTCVTWFSGSEAARLYHTGCTGTNPCTIGTQAPGSGRNTPYGLACRPEPTAQSHGTAGRGLRNLTIDCSPGIVWDVNEEEGRPLGEWLRQRREELSITLQEAQEGTRIRAGYLEALEAEDLASLPNEVVARGFLGNYAAYLGLDPQEALSRHARLTRPALEKPALPSEPSPFDGPFRPVPLHAMPGRRSWRRLWPVLAIVLVAALGVLAWQAYPYAARWLQTWQSTSPTSPTTTMASPAIVTATRTQAPTDLPVPTVAASAATLPVPTPDLTFTPTLSPTPPASPSPSVYTGIFLELVFTDTSWIQVTVDGVRQFQGELPAGTYRSWYGRERIELRVGNAGAVQVTVNGQKLGTLGATDEVVDQIFEIVGEGLTQATPTRLPTESVTVQPTPSLTPTGTPTAAVTDTPSITATATITAAAEPSATSAP